MRRARRGPIAVPEVYGRLFGHRGPAGWWPARSAFEVCLGAILVQNTAWTNVEKALAVRCCGLLSFAALRAACRRYRAVSSVRRLLQRNARRLLACPTFSARRRRSKRLRRRIPGSCARSCSRCRHRRETADSCPLRARRRSCHVPTPGACSLARSDDATALRRPQRLFMPPPLDAALFNDSTPSRVLAKDTFPARPLCPPAPFWGLPSVVWTPLRAAQALVPRVATLSWSAPWYTRVLGVRFRRKKPGRCRRGVSAPNPWKSQLPTITWLGCLTKP